MIKCRINYHVNLEVNKRQRKSYDPSFKVRVALEVCKGVKTQNEISKEYKEHANLLTKWKQQMQEGLLEIFSGRKRTKRDEKKNEELIKSLYQKIGQLEVDLD